jgi:hypothetical protein
LVGGRNEPWRWRGRSADGTTSRGGVRPQQLFYKYIEASRHAIPWPFTLAPTRSPVDCDVVGRWHQAEQSKSSARCQNGRCYLPSRMPKIIHRFPSPKSKAATPSPGRFRPFPPTPTRSPVDCDVVGRWHQAEQSKSSARCQNGPCCPPPRTPKILRFPPSKSEAATPSPGHSSPNPAALRLIVMFSMLETGRNDQIQLSGCKMKATPPPSLPTKIIDLPSLIRSRFSVPWLIPPKPSQAEVDCGVLEE